MFRKIDNINITDDVILFCLEYIKKDPSYSYDAGNLDEWWVDASVFKSNLDLKNICIGRMNTGVLSTHIDDDRESTLLIPFDSTSFFINVNDNEFNLNQAFIIDTTLPHSASSLPNWKFLAIDLRMPYDNLNDYLSTFDFIEVGIA